MEPYIWFIFTDGVGFEPIIFTDEDDAAEHLKHLRQYAAYRHVHSHLRCCTASQLKELTG